MAFGAQRAGFARLGIRFSLGIMGSADDLFVPFRPGRVSLMTTEASPIIAFRNFDIRVLRVSLPGTMTPFTRQVFVLEFRQLLHLVRMAFFAGLSPCKDSVPRRQQRQRIPPIEPILPEGGRRQKRPGDRIHEDNSHGQQQQPEDLGRHFEKALHGTG